MVSYPRRPIGSLLAGRCDPDRHGAKAPRGGVAEEYGAGLSNYSP